MGFSTVIYGPAGHHRSMKRRCFRATLLVRRSVCTEVVPAWCSEPVHQVDPGCSEALPLGAPSREARRPDSGSAEHPTRPVGGYGRVSVWRSSIRVVVDSMSTRNTMHAVHIAA